MSVLEHRLQFTVPPDQCQDSFPIGNGVLGATVYQPGGEWQWVVNHLDALTSHYHLNAQGDEIPVTPVPRDELKRLALEAHGDETHPGHQDYNATLGYYGAAGARRYTGLFDPVCGIVRVKPCRTEIPAPGRHRNHGCPEDRRGQAGILAADACRPSRLSDRRIELRRDPAGLPVGAS